MSIKFACDCGRSLRAPDGAVGRRGRCPACGSVFTVPGAEPQPVMAIPAEPPPDFLAPDNYGEYDFKETPAAPAPRRRPTVAAAATVGYASPSTPSPQVPVPIPTPASTGRPYRYLILLLALIPLAWATFSPGDRMTLNQRIEQTVEKHPEVAETLGQMEERGHLTKASLMAVLPDDRLDGALLAYSSEAHWLMAVGSLAAFFGLVVLLFPPGHTKVGHLVGVALFTGTAGVLLLLALQFIAIYVPLRLGGNIVYLVLALLWLIGQSYRLTMGDHSLVVSLIGFTAGVGFCEEACKAIPLLFKATGTGYTSWRSALLWGMVSGIGFGVSEGVSYCGDHYNGVTGGQIYLVRFVSCVALHAIWTAAVGVAIYRRQDHFRGQLQLFDWLAQTLRVVAVPMCLHGLYDTLLTHGLDWAALAVAVGSFGWLAWQIEQSKRVLDGFEAWQAEMKNAGKATRRWA